LYFLLVWGLVNLLQSYFTELHPDEAYYWLYSRFLDWGYFDHPPMVALFIRAGDSLFHNELSLRLLTVFSSTFSWWVLWQIVKKYQVEAKWFVLVVSSVSIFHIFGFTTTPDAPLFFFSTLFYFFYQQYLEKDKPGIAILLSLSLAGALYSKYHAVLLVIFTLIANPKLFRRKSFWLVAALTLILFLPHVFWQINHGFPSVKYHLFERSASHYRFEFTALFLIGQLFMAGPLVSWFWYKQIVRFRSTDIFTQTLLFNFVGTLIFFLANTLKVAVQPHWTLIGFLPFVLLVSISLQNKPKPTWLQPLLYINLLLLLLMRLGLMVKNPISMKIGVVKSYFGNPQWTEAIRKKVGNAYVIFPDNFQNPSWYSYYTNSLQGFSYDSRFYRRTQFDIWPLEDSLQQKRVYYVTDQPLQSIKTDTLNTAKGIFYGAWIDRLRTYQKILVEANVKEINSFPGKTVRLNLKITNPYTKPVNFSNANQQHKVVLRAYLMQEDSVLSDQLAPSNFNQIQLKPGESKFFPFDLKLPLQKGNYTLLFSVITPPFAGPRSSPFIPITVQ
ncbi:glycosyltransferase family 39 protein, partial [uncultured Mucilaginibacter sp.]|uniref:glycosyltransferase family 39 protein n=1 Tax=uncultured Mucilaginibacter sp. TaxID=797541 RepID=UPI00261508CA